jgi:hypothetical protein
VRCGVGEGEVGGGRRWRSEKVKREKVFLNLLGAHGKHRTQALKLTVSLL